MRRCMLRTSQNAVKAKFTGIAHLPHPRSGGAALGGVIIRASIIGFLCTPEHNAPVLYIRNAIEQDRHAGNRKPEKPGCRSSEGGEVAPRLLPIFRLYYREGPGK